MDCRSDWTKEEIAKLFHLPLLELIWQAATIHRKYQTSSEIQVCSLLSIKTGGCPEDCKYCPQSSRYQTGVEAEPLMKKEEVLDFAERAIAKGATRICLGAAWRGVRDGPQFDRILEVIKEIRTKGVEVCCTLGMLNEDQANRLKDAGLYAYNHNVDTSPEFYSKVTTTRSYQDRLSTLDQVVKAGIKVCCGGIIGMGESIEDRIGLLHVLATREPHPESVPINVLIPIRGTPFEHNESVSTWDLVRMVATARILMPKAMVRLSAGRVNRSPEEQALCFLAGANSIHVGEKLLTTSNSNQEEDQRLMEALGLKILPAYAHA